MNRLVVAAAVAVIAVAVLVISRGGSSGQEAEPAQRTQLVAALDITPIQQELAKVRDDLVALREAVTAADGLRNDVTQATAAVKAMSEQLTTLAETFKKFAEATQPVILELKPATQWEYKILRSRSEEVANRWGREGWSLVTAGTDWLYFCRPLRPAGKE